MKCTKVKFRSEEDADAFIKKRKRDQKKNEGCAVASYLCPFCLTWHITSKAKAKFDNNNNELLDLKKRVGKLELMFKIIKVLYPTAIKEAKEIISKSVPSPPQAQRHRTQER